MEVGKEVRSGSLTPSCRTPIFRRRMRHVEVNRSGARFHPWQNGSRGSIRASAWTTGEAVGPITWLCPLTEPNEVMALKAQMDGWFCSTPQKPYETSSRQDRRAPSGPLSDRALANSRGYANQDVRCQAALSERKECRLDIAFYGMALQRALPLYRTLVNLPNAPQARRSRPSQCVVECQVSCRG